MVHYMPDTRIVSVCVIYDDVPVDDNGIKIEARPFARHELVGRVLYAPDIRTNMAMDTSYDWRHFFRDGNKYERVVEPRVVRVRINKRDFPRCDGLIVQPQPVDVADGKFVNRYVPVVVEDPTTTMRNDCWKKCFSHCPDAVYNVPECWCNPSDIFDFSEDEDGRRQMDLPLRCENEITYNME